MNHTIRIKDLEVFAHHGVLKEENILGQRFIIDISLCLDLFPAGNKDDLNASVNYAEVADFITQYMQGHTFALIEAVAYHLMDAILVQFPIINSVSLEIKKPWAPIQQIGRAHV